MLACEPAHEMQGGGKINTNDEKLSVEKMALRNLAVYNACMFNRGTWQVILFSAAVFLLLLSACGGRAPGKPVQGYSAEAGKKAAETAISMIGRPYKYTGDTPAGFDCSGLVRYSYLTAGVDLPHGTASLKNLSKPVSHGSARNGDLVFFIQEGKRYSHVGIYIGKNTFVHAPSSGGKVRKDSLGDPYWKKHYLDTRRFI